MVMYAFNYQVLKIGLYKFLWIIAPPGGIVIIYAICTEESYICSIVVCSYNSIVIEKNICPVGLAVFQRIYFTIDDAFIHSFPNCIKGIGA